MVLNCISLITSKVKHLFTVISHVYFFRELFIAFAYFSMSPFILLIVGLVSFEYKVY